MYLAENELKVFHNISLLYPLAGPKLRKGEAMGKLSPLKDAYIVVGGGKVKEIGTGDAYKRHGRAELISLEGALVLPGFIDSHTHLVHAGSRENEMRKKLAGVDYLDILKSGGGILATVRATRNASFQELYREAEGRLKN
ncbi:MAG: imidazolonepropionase, partial [Bacilli bacterium]